MKPSYLLVALAAVVIGVGLLSFDMPAPSNQAFLQFQHFKQSFGRDYSEIEETYRFKIFSDNLQKIQKHNADATQTYTMGINEFADLTTEEFIGKVLMQDLSEHLYPFEPTMTPKNRMAPASVDWRQKNVLNPVKNQGRCGSCWAFSTTGTLESNLAIAKKELNSFSEQQLVDCCGDRGYQCQGCNGAWPEWAMNYVNAQGIVLENEYQYAGVKGACKAVPTAKKYLNPSKPWAMVPNKDLNSLKESIASTGPVSICVDASNWSLYRSGVFSNCGTTVLNHAVVAVGYQEDGTWIVRNSWGPTWGDQGHIRLASGNTCGIAEHVVVPNLL